MKKKLTKIIGVVLAALFSLGLFAGCDLITANNQADMQQVVADVNISNDTESLESALATLGSSLDKNAEVKSSLSEIFSTDEIYKRDLVAYFLSYGYSILQQNGSDYAATFESIMNMLVERKVFVQFATLFYLLEGEVRVDRDFIDFKSGYTTDTESDAMYISGITLDSYLGAIEEAEKAEGASSDTIVRAALSVFLTEDEKKYAEYQVMQAINSSIDSQEQEIIAESETSTSSETARTTPTGANQTDTYYPMDDNGNLNYGVYTGFNTVSECGEYEKLDGSTRVTRKRAYIRFLNTLNQNYLLSEADLGSSLEDISKLSYYDLELRNQYESLIISKFNASIALDMSDVYAESDLTDSYTEMVNTQQSDLTGFVSTMDSASDSSFVLYSPANRTYGYVLNILLPFNAQQTLDLTELQNTYGSGTRAYYVARQGLFHSITATDQRNTWFTGSEDYSFDATKYGMTAGTDYYDNGSSSDYLFFKDSFVAQGSRTADGIDRYAGKYPYNGEVSVRADGTYDLTPNTVESIDAFIAEMESYINFVADGDKASGRASGLADADFYNVTASSFGSSDNKIDYAKTVYYKGKADIGYTTETAKSFAADYMTKDSLSYKVFSAVNELMFAYSTDTGCLNSYLGYSIASKQESTDYVKEFEYAAQEAITEGGPGTYYVVGTDYGWHIIYVSFVYTGGNTYEGFNYSERNDENTFSYFFYQSQKASLAESYCEDLAGVIFDRMETSKSVVTKYEDRYSDLMAIGG